MSDALKRRMLEGAGLVLMVATIYLTLSLLTFSPEDPSFNNATEYLYTNNKGGVVGAFTSDLLLQYFGLASFAIPLVLGLYSLILVAHRPITHFSLRVAAMPLLLISAAALLHQIAPLPDWPVEDGIGNGGLVGKLLTIFMAKYLGAFGAFAFAAVFTFLFTLWLSGLTMDDIYAKAEWTKHTVQLMITVVWRTLKRIQFKKALQIELPIHPPKKTRIKPKVIRTQEPTKSEIKIEKEKQADLPLTLDKNFSLPTLHILDNNTTKSGAESEEALQQNARQLEAQLKNFGVEGEVTKICPGPVITIYELEPAPGVKTSAVVNLADDLARSMSAMSVRVAPIPGKSVIGIEMPNRTRQAVGLKDLLSTEEFETNAGKLTVALGVDTTGNPVYDDIAKMPHALIAGTTGSGKSVAMNAFILSLLYRMSPEELRFVMIDPKMLELSIYNDIPHLLSPVITDPNKAASALAWTVREMERRYELMSLMGVKNLQSFNAKFLELQADDNIPTRMVQTGFDVVTGQPKMEQQPLAESPLPYIVVVIDELADLMMVAGKQVEVYIARLAQMARAAGIHLLVATQRPSVDVVTGLIKANIPTRMSFHVTSKIDSRTVLDQMGAEQLLGKGDMLYMANGAGALKRLHGAFVSEDECVAVANHLREQGEPSYVTDITKPRDATTPATSNGGEEDMNDDPLYQQAIEIVAKEQKASTSFIQRHLKIGYNKAATLIEQMEADGLIGPADHVGKREVIVQQPPEGGY